MSENVINIHGVKAVLNDKFEWECEDKDVLEILNIFTENFSSTPSEGRTDVALMDEIVRLTPGAKIISIADIPESDEEVIY
jgi:hypothetical protein